MKIRQFRTPAEKLAWGGVMTAVSLALQRLGGMIGIGTYAAPMLGAVCTLFVRKYSDRNTAVLHWLATGLLCLILCADKELAALYLCLFGWYPLAKPALDRLRPKALGVLCRLVIFNAVILAVYVLLLLLVYGGNWAALGLGGVWMTLLFLAAGNVLFLCMDFVLGKISR